jgi:hypothetical protein
MRNWLKNFARSDGVSEPPDLADISRQIRLELRRTDPGKLARSRRDRRILTLSTGLTVNFLMWPATLVVVMLLLGLDR